MFSLASMKKSTKPEGGGNFEPLQPGLYLAKVEKAEPKKSNNTGTEYVALTMSVKDLEGNDKGRIWHNLFLTEKMGWVVDEFFTAVGCPIDDDVDENAEMSPEQVAKVIDGGRVLIHTTLKENTYNGKTTMRPELDIWGPMSGVKSIDEAPKWVDIIINGKDPDEVDDSFMNCPEDGPEEVEF